ncbi:MAG: hypothetical protein M1816_002549 [Peltula sp. TS41687]|nr:MAG: hypothetical protein M1816_002549 [Peltula sp. TS41687]
MDPQEVDSDSILRQTASYVQSYMSRFDASHDYMHVCRVVTYAQYISTQESSTSTSTATNKYDPLVLTLAAYLHDVGDRKYTDDPAGNSAVSQFLRSCGLPPQQCQAVQAIVDAVSYSREVADPDHVREVLERHPELGPVQDADRLDALGAVGVARCFAFGGAKRPGESLDTGILRTSWCA